MRPIRSNKRANKALHTDALQPPLRFGLRARVSYALCCKGAAHWRLLWDLGWRSLYFV
jgi:hypothetical protein